jgi:hypothetical protein
MKTIYIGNDNLVTLYDLRNALTQEYVNDAEAEVTVVDENSDPVDGGDWPMPMEYVADSNGKYIAALPETLQLTPGTFYKAVVSVKSGDLDALFRVPLVAKYRER